MPLLLHDLPQASSPGRALDPRRPVLLHAEKPAPGRSPGRAAPNSLIVFGARAGPPRHVVIVRRFGVVELDVPVPFRVLRRPGFLEYHPDALPHRGLNELRLGGRAPAPIFSRACRSNSSSWSRIVICTWRIVHPPRIPTTPRGRFTGLPAAPPGPLLRTAAQSCGCPEGAPCPLIVGRAKRDPQPRPSVLGGAPAAPCGPRPVFPVQIPILSHHHPSVPWASGFSPAAFCAAGVPRRPRRPVRVVRYLLRGCAEVSEWDTRPSTRSPRRSSSPSWPRSASVGPRRVHALRPRRAGR